MRIYVPRDAGAVAVGADEVAAALADAAGKRGIDSRSSAPARAACYWLEPLVEVATPAGRIAYGPVKASDVAGRARRRWSPTARHALRLGVADEIPFLQAPDAPDLRALRHRSIRARSRTTAPMAATRAWSGR